MWKKNRVMDNELFSKNIRGGLKCYILIEGICTFIQTLLYRYKLIIILSCVIYC